MERLTIILTCMLMPLLSGAQSEAATGPFVMEGANFFICILAGVLLAFAFQIILTMLSVATGISAVGNIQKNVNKNDEDNSSSSSNTGKKISAGVGIWTMITVSVSLFFASLLAVKLSLIGINAIGVTLGLVIWASFFILMTYLEMSAISSLAGGLISTVSQGVEGLFSRSDQQKAESLANVQSDQSAKAMRKQLEKLFDNRKLDRKIEDYVDRLAPQRVDINHIKREVKSLLTDIQAREEGDFKNHEVLKRIILEEAKGSNLSREDMQQLKSQVQNLSGVAKKIGGVANQDTSNEEKIKQGVEQLTNAEREQIDKMQEQIKQILRQSEKEELQPEKLEQDLEAIFSEPQRANDIVRAKASSIDHQTLVNIVSAANGGSQQKAENYVNKIEQVLDKVKSTARAGQEKGQQTGENSGNQMEEIQAKVKRIFQQTSGDTQSNLNRIKSDFTSLFSSAGNNQGLKYKLKHYNREQMLQMIEERTSMSREQAEPVVDKIVEARDTVMRKAEEIENQVKTKLEETKQQALAQAENTRVAAASAAWWLFATAIVSAAASALGGMMALENWMM